MIEIIVAEYAGACFGVRRTLALAEEAAAGGGAYTDGPLIHNPQEIERFKQKNVIPVGDLAEIEDAGQKLIIRSHGVPPARVAEAEARGLTVIDATCPHVKKAQLLAQKLAQDGYQVVIVGEAAHPEVEALVGWSGGRALVVADAAQARALAGRPELAKIGVIAQTTQTEENVSQVVAVLQELATELRVEQTICQATRQHQDSARALARQVDVMLVVGGKNSSNCKRLAQICKETTARVYHIETAAELDIHIVRGVKSVGITAGASTPDWIIEEVVEKMSELEKINGVEEEQVENVAETAQEMENGEPITALEETVAPEAEQVSYEQPAEPEAAAPVAEPVVEEPAAAEPVAEAAPAEAEPQEQAEAVSEQQTEEDKFAAEYGDMRDIRRGARVKGVVVQVKPEELLVDIGGKSEGVLAASELTLDDAKNILERFHVGDEIDVLILRKENQEGYPVLSKKRVDQDLAWDKLAQLKADNEIVTGHVTEVVKGGLLVDVGVRGFVPASLVGLSYVEDLSTYVGQDLQLKIIECDRQSNKLVLSAKAVLRKASQAMKEKTWAEIAEGQTRHGVVRRLTSFGAFVDVGGVDGLLHVSEMAWYRVNHPADLLKEGDELDVYVLGVDPDNEKISLGLKQLIANPWTTVQENYPEGSIIEAKVMRTTSFGAFLEVEPGVEGLVHISQLAHHRVEKTEDVVKPGDLVQVKILAIDPEAKRMSLSIKAATPKEEEIPYDPEQTYYGEDIPVGPFEGEDDAPVAAEPVAEEAAVEEAVEEAPAVAEEAAETPETQE